MFFLSELDHKKLLNQILPKARDVSVSDDLRGWNWHKAPLKPYYNDVRVPMYAVCSKYCPTGRDVFMNLVKKAKGEANRGVILGAAIHETVRTALRAYMDESPVRFEDWYESTMHEKEIRNRDKEVEERSGASWRFTQVMCESRFMEGVSRQPYASKRDVMATALPFLVEHRISGELLGLSGLLSVDCYDYMRNIVFDMKVSEEARDWYQLYPAGYALVLESVYEIPVNVGCTVYIRFRGSSLQVTSDLFFINEDLRSWWVEERDAKLQTVAQKKDPGFPNVCYEGCMYRHECGVG